ncbi:hypothetical protein KKD19_02495 [Patescibacteria group bacterium]|nr:hypothetical protein [Patescibacteria group bacterium]MBU4512092.1 hypothetical protein [Patescibacteria group bacterium]MCG2693417.1 hypothetical protein [Candidatus Parcubacteria bacterium]
MPEKPPTLKELKWFLYNIIGSNYETKTEHVGFILRFLENIPVTQEPQRREWQIELFGYLIQNFGIPPASNVQPLIFPEFIMSQSLYRDKIKSLGDLLSSAIESFPAHSPPPPIPIVAEKLWDRLQQVENEVDRTVALSKFLSSHYVPYYPETDVIILPQEIASIQEKLQNDFRRIDTLTTGGTFAGPLDEEMLIIKIILEKKTLKEQAMLLAFAKQRAIALELESIEEKLSIVNDAFLEQLRNSKSGDDAAYENEGGDE